MNVPLKKFLSERLGLKTREFPKGWAEEENDFVLLLTEDHHKKFNELLDKIVKLLHEFYSDETIAIDLYHSDGTPAGASGKEFIAFMWLEPSSLRILVLMP